MTIVNTGWLKDENGDKFAPKTLLSQVLTNAGESAEKYIEDISARSKPDWNQNNPDADDYIKNRPFYEEATTSTILSRIEFNYGMYRGPIDNLFIENETYNVLWDDVEYKCLAGIDGTGAIYIGNQSVALGHGAPPFPETIMSNEPFFMVSYTSKEGLNMIDIFTIDPDFHAVEIIGNIIEIHKIDKKYLPIKDLVNEIIAAIPSAEGGRF